MITIDGSQLRLLGAQVQAMPAKLVTEVLASTKKAATNVKKDLNNGLASSRHFRGISGSVTFDTVASASAVEHQIGPEKGRRGGSLANIAFFGGANGGGGTVDIEGPLAAEEPRLVKAVEDILDSLI